VSSDKEKIMKKAAKLEKIRNKNKKEEGKQE
jgi:hypothetical protein